MWRIYFIRAVLLFWLLAISLKLFYWQVIKSDDLIARAENQRFRTVPVQVSRGDILYSDGFVLASSQPTFLLYGLPKEISPEYKPKLVTVLAKKLTDLKVQDMTDPKAYEEEIKSKLLDKLSQDLFWVPLFQNLSLENKKTIEGLNLKGIGFEERSSRFYPEGSSAAHLLGFVGQDVKGDTNGNFGLEGYYNGELKGVPGSIRQENDALGLPILIGRYFSKGGKNGNNLILNIDRAVQFIVESSLKRGLEKYDAKKAAAVVMDPKTGAIIAMASFPNYDPTSYDNFPKENYKNPVVADGYEPGSTFKVLVMSAALNEDKVKPETQCDICSGPIQMGGFQIRTWNNKYYPQSSMTDVIVHSDNTGMVFVSKLLGVEKMYEYLQNFGFGSLTGIDLQEEASPDLKPKEDFKEIDLATSSFGQGIAVTPIQMVRAVSAVANGGQLMEPHVVREIRDENGSFKILPKVTRKVISEKAAKIITEMMVKAVDEGEAKFASLKGFKIAGKTGTAQIPVAGHYDPNKTIASFVGFAPADDPKFIMLVLYDQPSTSSFGAETAAPTFFEIAKELFTYYKIVPSE